MSLIFYLQPIGMMPSQIRSDTIAGAIIWSLAKMGMDVEELTNDKSLRVSSAYPFIALQNRRVHFGPKPKIPTSEAESFKEMIRRKKFSRIAYFQAEIINRIMRGEFCMDDIWRNDAEFRNFGGFLVEHSTYCIIKPMFTGAVTYFASRERNEINRISGKADNFFISYGYEYRNAGLYFLLEGSQRWRSEAVKGIRFLEERGIGGDISIGCGRFKFLGVNEGSPFNNPPEHDSIMTLSLYSPSQQEWSKACERNSKMFYSLVRRAGRSTDGNLKREAFFLGEGSIIPISSAEGTDVDLGTGGTKSLAWGRPFWIGFNSSKISC
ncbi:MAG: type III-A CRISPR-associated RAMP protein Csm4 [Candidatus Methanosuratincola petrocarbonis]